MIKLQKGVSLSMAFVLLTINEKFGTVTKIAQDEHGGNAYPEF